MRWYVTTNYYGVRCNCGLFISGRGGVKGNLHFGLPLSIEDFKRGSYIHIRRDFQIHTYIIQRRHFAFRETIVELSKYQQTRY